MKTILFLTGSYPKSRRSASMLCTHRVIECVASSNKYDVHVLCVQYPCELKEEHYNNIHVHRFVPSIWMRLSNCIQEEKNSFRFNRIESVIRKALTALWYPLTRPLTKRRFYKAACHLHLLYHFDGVITEHHELEPLMVGCCLKRTYSDLRHIAVLWDPVLGQIPSRFLPSFYTRSCIEKLESMVAKYSSTVISLSSMLNYYECHGDRAADKRVFLGIPGILQPDAEITTDNLRLLKEDAINIVYSGQLSPLQRNPIPFLKLLNSINSAHRINLLFFAEGARKEIEDYSSEFKGRIVYSDYIPIQEIHTIFRHADFLLNISHINSNMVPSKIFEYMSYGKPIISVYTTDGDSAKSVLDHYPEAISIDLKKPFEESKEYLERFIISNHRSISFDEIHSLFKGNTPEAYLEIINDSL